VRVLHLETGTHVYGGALQVLLLVEGLRQRGVENILAVTEGGEVEGEALARDLPVHALPMAGEADLAFPFRFRSLIRATSPDLVHLHSRRGADTLGAMGARWTGVPLILTRRVDNPEPSWAVQAKYNLFSRVVTISQAIRRVLVEQGVDPEKIRCVPSALDPTPFENPAPRQYLLDEFGLGTEARVIGMAAQFIPRKGHEVLLRAIPEILKGNPESRFLLFGQGPGHQEVVEQIRKAELEDVVKLPGFRSDLPSLLPRLDLLVHPATMEGLGIILLQAGASGVPVVASVAGGIPEAVVHEETGLLVPPGDAEALASAVLSLLADPARAKAMGDSGRKRVREAFSVDKMVDGNLAVYRELLPRP
jgi:glycosyltransferase involved in cell wall biosynthesis